MNLDGELLKKARELTYPQYLKIKHWEHGWPHVESVESTTEELAKLEGEDRTICGIAAYCHDLGRIVEEEQGDVSKELGRGKQQNHAAYSIKPTLQVLDKLRIYETERERVVEAVRVHSDFQYSGKNNVAKILRDSDKRDALGPWGILRMAAFIFRMQDFEIPSCRDNERIRALSEELNRRILARGNELFDERQTFLDKYIHCLDFVLEWRDMFETKSAPQLIKPQYEYTLQIRERCLKQRQ